MEWTEDTVLLLIGLYRQSECLWYAKHALYYNKLRKYDAWVHIAAELNRTVDECKKKVTTLLSSFRRERAKVKKSVGTGKGPDEIYESNWFAYKTMEFLFDKNCPRETLSTIPDEDSQSETQSTVADGPSDTEQEQMVSPRPSRADPVAGPSSGPPCKKSRRNNTSEKQLEKAFEILQTSAAQKEDNESDLFGKLVAKKLDSYSKVTKINVQKALMDIIFQADSGFYDQLQPRFPTPFNIPRPNVQYIYHPSPTSNAIHRPARPQSYVPTRSFQDPSYSQNQPHTFQQFQISNPTSPQEYHDSSPSVCSPPECSPIHPSPSSEEATFEELVKSALTQ